MDNVLTVVVDRSANSLNGDVQSNTGFISIVIHKEQTIHDCSKGAFSVPLEIAEKSDKPVEITPCDHEGNKEGHFMSVKMPNAKLTYCHCTVAEELLDMDVSNNLLTSLMICSTPNLVILNFENNRIVNFNTTTNAVPGANQKALHNLGVLKCGNNLLSNLDLSHCSELKTIKAEGNESGNGPLEIWYHEDFVIT